MANRNDQLRNLNGGVYDVLVIGAGINGAASAAALAAAGVQVALVDAADFAVAPDLMACLTRLRTNLASPSMSLASE